MIYEILFIENDLYYINYYEFGLEFPAVRLKLTHEEFATWSSNKEEI